MDIFPDYITINFVVGHTGFVNSCDSARRGPQMITSASDDCTIKVWDPRKRGGDAVTTFNNNYQVMSVCFNDTADQVITGGLDNEIKVLLLILFYTLFLG